MYSNEKTRGLLKLSKTTFNAYRFEFSEEWRRASSTLRVEREIAFENNKRNQSVYFHSVDAYVLF